MKNLKTKINNWRTKWETFGSPYTQPYTVVRTKKMCFTMDEFDELQIQDEARATRGLKRKPKAQYERESRILHVIAISMIIISHVGFLLLLDWFYKTCLPTVHF